MDNQRQSTESSSPSNGTKAWLLGLLIIGPILYVFLPDSRLSSVIAICVLLFILAGVCILFRKSKS